MQLLGAVTRTLAGGVGTSHAILKLVDADRVLSRDLPQLPSSSSKFVNMTCSALEKFEEEHGFKFQKITKIPLEGDGTIQRKVAK